MSVANWTNQTIWTGDNLDVMRGMNSESVDLLYLDPPFNSNQDYAAPIGSEAAGAAFKDTWTLDDVDLAWHGQVAEQHPGLYSVIDAAGFAHGKPMKAYLTMMSVRLLEMERLLKPTGSIYLHCDPTAGHYIKLLLDTVFGGEQFRNDIVWQRTSAHSSARRFGPNYDTLFFYSKSDSYTWREPTVAHDQQYLLDFYRHSDERGPFTLSDLTAAGTRSGTSGLPWKEVDPTSIGRHWAIPQGNADPDLRGRSSQEKLDILEQRGRIVWPDDGEVPRYKRYLDEVKEGQRLQAVWTDIRPIGARAKERVGYPTQKPLKLLDRIIAASSNPGDMVLDPFCGCATACIAAEQLGRQWVGIDISPKAAELVKLRMQKELGLFYNGVVRTDSPSRTDIGDIPPYNTKSNKQILFGQQEGRCMGCETAFPFRNLTIDHIVPRSRAGSDHIDNLQLLCNFCNSTKGTGTQAELIAKLHQQGILPAI